MPFIHRPRYSSNPVLSRPDARYPYAPEPGEVVDISVADNLEGPAPVCTIHSSSQERQELPCKKADDCWTLAIGPFGEDERVQYSISGLDQVFAFHTAKKLKLVQAGIEHEEDLSLLVKLVFERDVIVYKRVHAESIDHSLLSEDGTLQIGNYLEREIYVLYHKDWNPEYRLVSQYEHHCNAFMGLGERFNSVNQFGQRITMRVYEEYKEQHRTARSYMPVPVVMTDDNWGVYVDTYEPVIFDFDTKKQGIWDLRIPFHSGDTTDIFVLEGSPSHMLQEYAKASAHPKLPPKWVFGPWMSSNEWNSQQRVLKEVALAQDHDIPFTVVVLEAWSDEENFYIWNDAVYQAVSGDKRLHLEEFTFPEDGHWPDPKGLVDKIHDLGAKLILWQIPVLKQTDEEHAQHSADSMWMEQQEYTITTADGEPYRVRPWWFPGGLVPDFSQPEAREWWLSKRQYLLDELGVDGFKTDGGEHLWGTDVRARCIEQGDALANRFAHDYLESYQQLISETNDDSSVLFSRSGSLRSQATPIHWCGDQNSTWEAHRSVLTSVLSGGLSGIPFIGWDIGGFSGPLPESELYIRSTQMACFGTLMQFHSEFNDHREPHVDRSPWNVAKRTDNPHVLEVYRYYAKLRMKLSEYLYASAEISSYTGLPLMRPLCIDYPEHPEAFTCFDQYQLGPDILVAPVLNKGVRRVRVIIPDESWYDGWSGNKMDSGIHEYQVDMDTIPIFNRKSGKLSAYTDSIFPLPAIQKGKRT